MNEHNPYQAPQPSESSPRPVNGWGLPALLSWPFYFAARFAAIGLGLMAIGAVTNVVKGIHPIVNLSMALVSALLCRWCWKTANKVKREEL